MYCIHRISLSISLYSPWLYCFYSVNIRFNSNNRTTPDRQQRFSSQSVSSRRTKRSKYKHRKDDNFIISLKVEERSRRTLFEMSDERRDIFTPQKVLEVCFSPNVRGTKSNDPENTSHFISEYTNRERILASSVSSTTTDHRFRACFPNSYVYLSYL